MISSDHRQHERRAITLHSKLDFHATGNVNGTSMDGVIRNISASGAFMECAKPLEAGLKGIIELILPTDIGPRIPGIVQRVTPQGIGFKFDSDHLWLMRLL